MTGTRTLAARAAVGGFAALASVALGVTRRFEAMGQRRFDVLAVAGLLVSRIGLYSLIFLQLRIPPRGDIPFFYRPEALAVLAGMLPYRQFPSSYAPLHPFLDAAVLRLWDSPLALILFSILVEALAFPLGLRLLRCGYSESKVRLAALLYLASPISLQFVTIDGQDNVLIALFLMPAMLFLYRGRGVLSGASLGLAVVLVKFLPLLFVPVLLLACRQRMRWLAGFGGVLAIGYLPFVFLHLPLLYPLQAEGQARTASDLPFLVEAALGSGLPGRVCDGVLLLVIASILVALGLALRGAGEQRRLTMAMSGCTAMTLALLLLSKKSWPPYLMLVLLPLCMTVAVEGFSRWRLCAFAGFSWVAIFAHSVWATTFLQIEGPALHAYLASGEARALGFLLLQILLIGGYAWLLVLSLGRMQAPLLSRRSNPGKAPLVPSCAR